MDDTRVLLPRLLLLLIVSMVSIGSIVFVQLTREIPPGQLVWEGSIVDNIIQDRKNSPQFQDRLSYRTLWRDGLVSNGNQSLVFGGIATEFVTLATDLRLISLGLMALTIFLGIYLLRPWAIEHVILVGLVLSHPAVLFYLGYGVNVGFSVGLSFLLLAFSERLRREKESSWLMVIGLTVTMVVATYEYTPVRFVSLLLIPTFLFALWRHNHGRKRFLLPLFFLVMAGGLAGYQWHFGTLHSFWNARGEQIVVAQTVPSHWVDWLASQGITEAKDLNFLGMALATAKARFPELLSVAFTPIDTAFWCDPPRMALLFGFLPLFFILGLSRFRDLRWCLFVIGSISALMLFTTRVDVHRMAVLIPWLMLPASCGVANFLRHPRSLVSWCAGVLVTAQIIAGYALYLATFPYNR